MKTILYCFAFLFTSTFSLAQESDFTFYLNSMFEITDSSDAVYIQKMTGAENNSFESVVYSIAGNQIKMKGVYIKVKDEYLENGRFTFFYPSGTIESQGYFVYGYKSGVWSRYDMEGNEKADRYYNPQLGKAIRKYKEQLAEMPG